MRRLLTAALSMTVLTACASTTGTSIPPTPIPFIAEPTPSPSDPTPTPTSTPPAAPPAAPPAPIVLNGTFLLVAIGGSHASGLVQVTERNGSFVASVSVRELAPGISTLHAVHIHAGSCSNPYGGLHLTVLGLLPTGPAGTGMLAAPLAPFYVANGNYVIVYSNTSPQVIVACANLMALA